MRKAQTFEGVVENGRIRLDSEVQLLEGAKVYVVVAGPVRLRSPRLVVRELADDFKMEIVKT